MIRKKYQAVAYLVRGHWACRKADYEDIKTRDFFDEKVRESSLRELDEISNSIVDLWFVFADYRPEETSNLSLDEKINLPSLTASSRRYDSDVISAIDDIKQSNQWNLDTTTALGIADALNEKVNARRGRFLPPEQSKIALWRICKTDKVGEGKLKIPYVIEPGSREYEYYKKRFKFSGDKTIISDFPEKKDLASVFVINKILEIRNAKIESDGSYSLYDITSSKPKLIKKTSLQGELESDELELMKQLVKNIERGIDDSGPARRAATYTSGPAGFFFK